MHTTESRLRSILYNVELDSLEGCTCTAESDFPVRCTFQSFLKTVDHLTLRCDAHRRAWLRGMIKMLGEQTLIFLIFIICNNVNVMYFAFMSKDDISVYLVNGVAISPAQRIYIYKERTASPFVFTTSVFCLSKPEAERKTTPELLLVEWWTIFAWGLQCTEFYVRCILLGGSISHFKKIYEFACFAQLSYS